MTEALHAELEHAMAGDQTQPVRTEQTTSFTLAVLERDGRTPTDVHGIGYEWTTAPAGIWFVRSPRLRSWFPMVRVLAMTERTES